MSNQQSPPEGDPGKLAYFRNPNWTGTPRSRVEHIDPRVCPGCLFSASMKPTPHVDDARCQLFRTKQAAAEIESGAYSSDPIASVLRPDEQAEYARREASGLCYCGDDEAGHSPHEVSPGLKLEILGPGRCRTEGQTLDLNVYLRGMYQRIL